MYKTSAFDLLSDAQCILQIFKVIIVRLLLPGSLKQNVTNQVTFYTYTDARDQDLWANLKVHHKGG